MKLNTKNQIEINHFRNLSSTWWNEAGPFRILHAINPLRLTFIKEKIGVQFRIPENAIKPFKDLRILDVGCGGGLLCEPLARLGADVTGIDPVFENIVVAKEHAHEMGLSITYFPCAIEDLTEDIPLFDVIIASEIIEHVDEPNEFLKSCVEHLSERGGMVVTTLNKTLKSYFFGVFVAEYILKWAPQGTHRWNKFIPPDELSQKLSILGLSNQDITGLGFSPLLREWSLVPSTDINYFLWASRS
ncbi:MAG: bifunctional 2-polyprenyl-6-hydroxyphenol methylase/3-demethylubiquinol 3-O-methyltransferase UbiG [Alphaproteobacteria bacterium]|nr:bifunctional 2-polyprenyl-6-hydroxyphenol methylase/3-demethylubiquinol 3-O-methyltransferase UbiG [Alphaproteobacteria bacterium]